MPLYSLVPSFRPLLAPVPRLRLRTHTQDNYRNPPQSSNDGQSPLSLKDIRKALEEKDREYIWEQVSTRESLASLTPDVNWLRLWDDARDYGLQGARALMANLRILTTPKFENYSCQICGHKLDSKQFPADHIASIHLGCSADHLRDLLLDPSDETFTLPASLRTSLPSS